MFIPTEIHFIGLFLEGFFCGFYSGIFAVYLQFQASNKDNNKRRNIIFYSVCSLYVLSIVIFACDIATCTCISELFRNLPVKSLLRIMFIGTTSFGCSDFLAQFILIYRCWIVWGCNIRVVIIPSILALTFLSTWLLYGTSVILSDQLVTPGWGKSVILTSLSMSLTVNALVTSLIVFRILKVFWEVRATHMGDQIFGSTGGNKLRHVIFILIESGMALFSIQLARLAVTIVGTESAYKAFSVIVGIHEMLNGITPTIILVRTSMGLSFHDEKSMEEAVIESLRFGSDHPNSLPGTGSIGIVGLDSRNDDRFDFERYNGIDAIDS